MEYLDEDGWDFTHSHYRVEPDGSTRYEFMDSEGNEFTEEFSATGEEILGDYCDEDLPPEETWCFREWIDVDGNHHVETTDPDGNVCHETFNIDGTYLDCDGNLQDMNGNSVQDSYEDADGNQVFVFIDEAGNEITQTINAETGEITEVKADADGLTVVHEEWDAQGNYIVFLEDADTGNRIIEVMDWMGMMTTTVYYPDGTSETTKVDEEGNDIVDAYYDENDNYVVIRHDANIGAEVTETTDPWGYVTIEWDGGF